jgi:hypothetical protein
MVGKKNNDKNEQIIINSVARQQQYQVGHA